VLRQLVGWLRAQLARNIRDDAGSLAGVQLGQHRRSNRLVGGGAHDLSLLCLLRLLS
jgi:hypothetical protein